MTHEQPIIVGLDIGTTKIAAIAGRKNEFGKLEIVGFGKAKSNGVQHGMVINIDQVLRSIEEALQDCQKSNPDLNFNEVYVGIAGHHIKSLQTRGDIVTADAENEITKEDVERLVQEQYSTYVPAGDAIIDVIPQEFTIDNLQTVINPIGAPGIKLGANFHIITGDRNAIKNINRSVFKAGLKITDLVLQPLASAAAVMSDPDLEAGVCIVDIGGGTTDIAVFYEGILKHTAVIPFGGENITNDIKVGLGVLKTQAEQLKVQYGSAVVDDTKTTTYIAIPGYRGLPSKEVSVTTLSQIINARVNEILDFVNYHIKQIGLDTKMLNGGIILTGGGSQLKHIIQLTEYSTGLNARVGLPSEHLAANQIDELAKPIYSTCIGLILKGYNDFENNRRTFENSFTKVIAPDSLVKEDAQVVPKTIETPTPQIETTKVPKRRKLLDGFFEKFKTNIVDLFKEEQDQAL
jgi:cell division protein FtsA